MLFQTHRVPCSSDNTACLIDIAVITQMIQCRHQFSKSQITVSAKDYNVTVAFDFIHSLYPQLSL